MKNPLQEGIAPAVIAAAATRTIAAGVWRRAREFARGRCRHIPITAITRMRLAPGELLVINVDRETNPPELEALRDALDAAARASGQTRMPVIILGPGTKLTKTEAPAETTKTEN